VPDVSVDIDIFSNLTMLNRTLTSFNAEIYKCLRNMKKEGVLIGFQQAFKNLFLKARLFS